MLILSSIAERIIMACYISTRPSDIVKFHCSYIYRAEKMRNKGNKEIKCLTMAQNLKFVGQKYKQLNQYRL